MECDQYGYRFEAREVPDFRPVLKVYGTDGTLQTVDIRTLPFIRFDDNSAHSQRRFAMNLGGIRTPAGAADYKGYAGKAIGDDLIDDRVRTGDVGGVGPDRNHPFVVRNLRAWTSQWAWHSGSPSIFVDGLHVDDGNYGVWRSRMDLLEFRNTSFEKMANKDWFYGWGGNPSIADDYDHGLEIIDTLPPATVIAVLIGILVPALSKAREAAQATSCLSNLRQVNLALVMFANDHGGRLPQIGTARRRARSRSSSTASRPT